jgi:predicted NUDIX family NTP pyrophosphohydrolase
MPTDKRGRTSAGLLLFRRPAGRLEVLLAHPGGPFHAGKDADAWTLPKGETQPGEALIDVARREFEEETGHAPPDGEPIDLGEIYQKSGKRVVAWALEGDLDPTTASSNTFELEWPRRSGRQATFQEIDRVAWYDLSGARGRLKQAQEPFLDRLVAALSAAEGDPAALRAADGDPAPVADGDPAPVAEGDPAAS